MGYLHPHELICKLLIIVVFYEQDEMSVLLYCDTDILLLSYCTPHKMHNSIFTSHVLLDNHMSRYDNSEVHYFFMTLPGITIVL